MRYICEKGHIFEHTAKMITEMDENAQYEIPVCPHCFSRIYSEYVLDKKAITSVINVDLAEVDAKLAEGYEVESLYAKTATLVKRTGGRMTPSAACGGNEKWNSKQVRT